MPNPSDFKTEDDFVSSCIGERQNEHPDESHEQSAAVCYSMWADKSAKNGVVYKTHASEVQNMEFVLSDETVDRFGDVINSDGWVLDDFNKNPIALFNHDSNFPIGKWNPPRVANRGLRSKLELAPEGTSARIDEIRKLVDAGILRATSVGFHPITSEPRKSAPGTNYVKSALVECSLVSVPANPNALAIARSLKVSDDTLKIVFGENADKKPMVKRGVTTNGKNAEKPKPTIKRSPTMSGPLSQRIVDTQERIVKLKDQLGKHMEELNDESPSDEQTTVTDDLTQKIDQQEKSLEMLKRAEQKLAVKAVEEDPPEDEKSDGGMKIRNYRPFAAPMKKINAVDHIFRALTVQVKHHATHGRHTMVDVLKDTYGEDERTYAMMNILTRTLVTPGSTTVSGWAQELVTVAIGEFFGLLQPVSIYAKLAALGGRFTFGPSGVISIPTRTSGSTVGGAFFAQGGNIPVKKASFSAITLTPKKMGVISTFTRELAEHSTPSIEQLLRDLIIEDTANAIDAVLMDTNVATTTRPAGLGAGLSTQTPNSPGTDLVGVIADIKTLTNALFSATNGNVRTPVWIMPPGYANAISLATIAATGIMPFRDEISAGRLAGYPIIQSTNTIPSDTIWLMDAADFISATGDLPNFDVSDSATIVMDDAPTDIITGGTQFSGTVKSLYQTDSLAVRMRLDINWAMRRTGMVLFTTGVNWNAP